MVAKQLHWNQKVMVIKIRMKKKKNVTIN